MQDVIRRGPAMAHPKDLYGWLVSGGAVLVGGALQWGIGKWLEFRKETGTAALEEKKLTVQLRTAQDLIAKDERTEVRQELSQVWARLDLLQRLADEWHDKYRAECDAHEITREEKRELVLMVMKLETTQGELLTRISGLEHRAGVLENEAHVEVTVMNAPEEGL